jgi:photosystem II stability/assembly factor-like uncharacterized protein
MKRAIFSIAILLISVIGSTAQESKSDDDDKNPWSAKNFSGLSFRSIGPALMSGRISDIAIHPQDDNLWYVAAGSGGVWKTTNAGVTWTPVFDEQSSYSIGCVTIDPSNPNTVWVGTGENVGGRHVGFGDGIYCSRDGGGTWKNMGLRQSEHISKVIVHPTNSDVLYVAVQGPLWAAGGERGFYKTTDGGKTWNRTLGDDQWTGVTDIAIDPRDPKRLYAATWDRHRTTAGYVGGGPGSGLHRSDDGGDSWLALKKGLPESNMGKIGLAISPHRPDTVWAAIELDRRSGGVFRSDDRGNSWAKLSDAVSGGTGPHYYQELVASPHQPDCLYLMDVRIQVSDDGGKTFRYLSENNKHSDNHALAFRKDDPNYLLCGCDGGVYESFDLAKSWRFFNNLPVTQFYKIALDDAQPFFNIYGGTQDNSTEGGPSRTDNVHGIQNSDWRVVLDWDGHQPATEPGNPNLLYAERQEGFISRVDISTGEIVDIQPQAGNDEPFERFNWDTPILISPHNPTRLYVGSYRVWRSDNRGDEWTPISGDLTKNQERLALPIMGRQQSWDNPWDLYAMSTYNTITSLAESPLVEGLLYAGTDDGLIQISENGGGNWRKIGVGMLPGVPETAFINDIRADLHDANTVYIALDNHKTGDFRPYLLVSQDRGQTWNSIIGNLPDRLLIWRVVQDHVRPELIFAATEFGVYFTIDSGTRWTQLKGGLPTISIRDIHIHRRENDLVAATFGRGIYVLDDITPWRELNEQTFQESGVLFQPRDAWWYFPRPHLGFEVQKGDQGDSHFVAPNPPFGAVFTYYLPADLKSSKETRQAEEKQRRKDELPTPFPGWETLAAERLDTDPAIWLTVSDADGAVVRRVPGVAKKGFHRIAWDLRHPTPDAIKMVDDPLPMWGGPPKGLMCAPGEYQVALSQTIDGKSTMIGEPRKFKVVPLRQGALPAASSEEVARFWRAYESAVRHHSALQVKLAHGLKKIERLEKVLANSQADVGDTDSELKTLRDRLMKLDSELNGDRVRQQVGEKFRPIIADRLFSVARGVDRSTYGPTPTHRQMLEIAEKQIERLRPEINAAADEISQLAKLLFDRGGPWIEGESLPVDD